MYDTFEKFRDNYLGLILNLFLNMAEILAFFRSLGTSPLVAFLEFRASSDFWTYNAVTGVKWNWSPTTSHEDRSQSSAVQEGTAIKFARFLPIDTKKLLNLLAISLGVVIRRPLISRPGIPLDLVFGKSLLTWLHIVLDSPLEFWIADLNNWSNDFVANLVTWFRSLR